ncbi:hypothetical protein GCM10011506_17460 [Marivirga lumbricoides]|uniref:Uncharacterized protein n=1 Tax=Marivirga lumbricoides TaxID=1046115 RepID=A0ABQ1M013_9BACT|nr:hypothetical protein GCM10011506_17460 [Marivirga lumbricoides]
MKNLRSLVFVFLICLLGCKDDEITLANETLRVSASLDELLEVDYFDSNSIEYKYTAEDIEVIENTNLDIFYIKNQKFQVQVKNSVYNNPYSRKSSITKILMITPVSDNQTTTSIRTWANIVRINSTTGETIDSKLTVNTGSLQDVVQSSSSLRGGSNDTYWVTGKVERLTVGNGTSIIVELLEESQQLVQTNCSQESIARCNSTYVPNSTFYPDVYINIGCDD